MDAYCWEGHGSMLMERADGMFLLMMEHGLPLNLNQGQTNSQPPDLLQHRSKATSDMSTIIRRT